MRSIILGVATCLLAATACADEVQTAAKSPMKVDLGEVVETGAVQPVNGMTSSGQPSEAALEVFADNGYVAVIDLRTEGEPRGIEEGAVVERLGMEYVSLPIPRNDVTFENAARLDELLASYDEPVLVHCGSGNRVGALLALSASAKGADDEAAIQAGREGGLTKLEPKIREALSGADQQ